MSELWPLFGRVGAVIAPVLVIALAGFVWAKNDPGFKSRLIGDVSLYIGVPCLLFATLIRSAIAPELLALSAAGAALFILLTLGAIGALAKLTNSPANPRLTGLGFSNWGNVSMPICFFAFGEVGLTLAATFFATSIFLQFTLGWRLAAGTWPWRAMLTQPLLWALFAAIALKSAAVIPPTWVMDTATLAGGAAIPCMLLALGGGIARMHPAGLGAGFIYAAARLALGLAIGFGLVTLLPFPAEMKPIVLLISIMPLAVFNYILAEKTDQDAPTVAGYVVASTALAILVLPIALVFLMPQ